MMLVCDKPSGRSYFIPDPKNAEAVCLKELKSRLGNIENPEEIEDMRRRYPYTETPEADVLFDEALDRIFGMKLLTSELSLEELYGIFERCPENHPNNKSLRLVVERLSTMCEAMLKEARTFKEIFRIHQNCPPPHYNHKIRKETDLKLFSFGIKNVEVISVEELCILSNYFVRNNYYHKKIRRIIGGSKRVKLQFTEDIRAANRLDHCIRVYEQYSNFGKYFHDIVDEMLTRCVTDALRTNDSKDFAWEIYLKIPRECSARHYVSSEFIIRK